MKHMKQKQRTPPAPLSPTHETETQPQASGPPGRNFQPLHERKRSRRERGALKISAAVAAATRMKGVMLEGEIFGLRYICGPLDTLLLHRAIHLPHIVRAIRGHCRSSLAILHTLAARIRWGVSQSRDRNPVRNCGADSNRAQSCTQTVIVGCRRPTSSWSER